MFRKDLAIARGLSGGMVTRLAQRGMPCESVDAARRWRERHLEHARTKGVRAEAMPRSGADAAARDAAELARTAAAALRLVDDLAGTAAALLPIGRFATVEPALRRALRAVPLAFRDLVLLELPGDPRGPVPAGLHGAAPEPAGGRQGDSDEPCHARFLRRVR